MTMRVARWAQKPSAGILIVALIASLPGDVYTQAKPAAQAAATPAPDPTVDGGWPRSFVTSSGADLVIYQPQILSWDGRQHMVAYAAVAYQPKQAKTPSLGTIRMEANTSAALEDRLVRFSPIALTESNFGTLPKPQVQEIVTTIQGGLPESERVIALDRILANIDQSQIIPKNVEGVKADPPQIFFSTRPAILIGLDGDPVWSPIADNDLKFAVNTNWDLFQHEQLKTFFLRNDRYWLKASDLKGPWTPAGTLPASFSKLPADENWKDVKSALPGAALDPKLVPAVHVSTVPSEMILLTGNPTYAPVSGTRLLWVNNTESDLFRLGQSGPVFFLVAGRWFSAANFTGPWAFASTTLPEDFKRISLEHPRSRVLASVPGTPQAAEAVLLTQVPQTARVNRKQLQAPEVIYQGEPQFTPIETTKMSRAANTDKDIIKVGDVYYMCFQGVWFMSKSANGPWAVTDSVPGEIYTIPASSPSHNVTYVTVVEDDDDEWVTYAAVAGYTGMMVAWGCAVWGTGYYYPPYVGYGGFYPVYYPFYPTYGYGAWYNPWTGGYGRGAAWTARTAARELPRDTTRGPAPTRAEPSPGDLAAPVEQPPRTTRAPAHTGERSKVRASTAAGVRREFSAATIGCRPRGCRTASRATRRASRRVAAGAKPSHEGDRAPTVASSEREAATCMPAATAMSIGKTTAAGGRSTTTARGTR